MLIRSLGCIILSASLSVILFAPRLYYIITKREYSASRSYYSKKAPSTSDPSSELRDKRDLEIKRLRADNEDMQALLLKHGIAFTPRAVPPPAPVTPKQSRQRNSKEGTSTPVSPHSHLKPAVILEKEEPIVNTGDKNSMSDAQFVPNRESSSSPSIASVLPVTTNANQSTLNIIVEQHEIKESKTDS